MLAGSVVLLVIAVTIGTVLLLTSIMSKDDLTVSDRSMQTVSHVLYINLDGHTERQNQIEREIQRIGLWDVAQRFSAIRKTPGAIGCFLSHLGCLERAQTMKGHVLILEDDFQFEVDRKTLNRYLAEAEQVTQGSWDVIVFGQFALHMAHLGGHVYRLLHATTTSGYLVHEKYIPTLYQKWKQAFEQVEHKGADFAGEDNLDQIQVSFQKEDLWVGFDKPLGGQRAGISTIGGGYADNRWSMTKDKKFYRYGNQLHPLRVD